MEKRVVAAPMNGLSIKCARDRLTPDSDVTKQAMPEARRAAELTTYKVNNFLAPTVNCHLAVVYAWTGQNDLAIAKLSELLNNPAIRCRDRATRPMAIFRSNLSGICCGTIRVSRR